MGVQNVGQYALLNVVYEATGLFMYFFIYSLFNDALSRPDYNLQHQMIELLMSNELENIWNEDVAHWRKAFIWRY